MTLLWQFVWKTSVCRDCQQNCTLYDDGKEYECKCNKGYKLDEDGVSCSGSKNTKVCKGIFPLLKDVRLDINECVDSPNICGREDVCKNQVGSYECTTDKCKVFHHKNYVRSYSYPNECCKMSKGEQYWFYRRMVSFQPNNCEFLHLLGKCGQNNQNRNSRALRIFRGESASAGMWPWHVGSPLFHIVGSNPTVKIPVYDLHSNVWIILLIWIEMLYRPKNVFLHLTLVRLFELKKK